MISTCFENLIGLNEISVLSTTLITNPYPNKTELVRVKYGFVNGFFFCSSITEKQWTEKCQFKLKIKFDLDIFQLNFVHTKLFYQNSHLKAGF